MTPTDDLEKQVRALLPQGSGATVIQPQELGGLIVLELCEQRAVGFGGHEMVDHAGGGGKEDLDVGIARGRGQACGQEGFARPRVAKEHDIHGGAGNVEIAEVEDARFLRLPRCVMMEVELVNGEFVGECGLTPPQGDGVVKALLAFDVSEAAERGEGIEMVLGGVLDDVVEGIGHAFEAEVNEFVCELLVGRHGFLRLRMNGSNSARDGSSRRI
jgi:hypothetical protein